MVLDSLKGVAVPKSVRLMWQSTISMGKNFLFRQTWQCNENITVCGGKRAVVLPTGCPRSAGLLAGICRTKVKVPAIPRGWGGAVVTND